MTYRDAKTLEALTRQFVLGTMSRRARRRFSRMVDEDNEIAASVYALEEKLLPMAWSMKPVVPSELVWRRISRQAGFGASHRQQPGGPAAPNRWPIVAATLVAALLLSTFGWWQEWARPPEVLVETVTETVPLEPVISVVADDQRNAIWVARIYSDLQRVDVSVANEPDQHAANDYELWVLREDGVPVSLGLLPQSGKRQLALTANAVDALQRGNLLAVSLEPAGGSPSDTPTGPVLYTAALLAP